MFHEGGTAAPPPEVPSGTLAAYPGPGHALTLLPPPAAARAAPRSRNLLERVQGNMGGAAARFPAMAPESQSEESYKLHCRKMLL